MSASNASRRCDAMTSATPSSSLHELSRYAAALRWRTLRSRRVSVPYATLLTRSCTKTYWPRSGDLGSDWMASRSLLTRLARAASTLSDEHLGDRPQRRGGEGLAEDRGILEEPPLGGSDAVEARGDQSMERLGYLERVERPLDMERAVLRRPADRGRAACAPSRPRTGARRRRARGCARSGRRAVREPCPRAAGTSPPAAAGRGRAT